MEFFHLIPTSFQLAFSGSFANLQGTEIVLGVQVLCGSEKSHTGDLCFQPVIVENFWATLALDIASVIVYVRVRTFLVQLMPKWPQLAPCGTPGEKLTVLGDINVSLEGIVSGLRLKEPSARWDRYSPKTGSI